MGKRLGPGPAPDPDKTPGPKMPKSPRGAVLGPPKGRTLGCAIWLYLQFRSAAEVVRGSQAWTLGQKFLKVGDQGVHPVHETHMPQRVL